MPEQSYAVSNLTLQCGSERWNNVYMKIRSRVSTIRDEPGGECRLRDALSAGRRKTENGNFGVERIYKFAARLRPLF